MKEMKEDFPPLTRRQWLEFQVMKTGSNWVLAKEAVATTALAHPEWNMEETKTWPEWIADEKARVK